MAWTEDDLTRVKETIASGALTVRYADRTVTYRSLEELRSIEREIRAEIQGATPQRRRFVEYRSEL